MKINKSVTETNLAEMLTKAWMLNFYIFNVDFRTLLEIDPQQNRFFALGVQHSLVETSKQIEQL